MIDFHDKLWKVSWGTRDVAEDHIYVTAENAIDAINIAKDWLYGTEPDVPATVYGVELTSYVVIDKDWLKAVNEAL